MEVYFIGMKEFFDRASRAIKTKVPYIQPKNEVYFQKVEAFQNLMTPQAIELLNVIANVQPKTIRDLAKHVRRDIKEVLKDCNSLAFSGFIRFPGKPKIGRTLRAALNAEDCRASRESMRSLETKRATGDKKPVLVFPYRRIIVHLPHSDYQIEFPAAA